MDLTLRDILDRYGPALAVVAALLLIAAVVPANVERAGDGSVAAGDVISGESDLGVGETFDAQGNLTDPGSSTVGTGGVGAGTGSRGSADGTAGSPGSGGAGGVGGAGASVAAGAWGPGNYPAPGPDTKCTSTGAMPDFSMYSPRCLPRFTGSNGGATAQGVSGDQVKIVWYRNQVNAATQATLQGIGASDSAEIQEGQVASFVRYYNTHYETYGREVVIKEFQGTGDAEDENVLRADAVAIANQEKPFAVFQASVAVGSAFTEELGARGVICLCTTSAPRSLYTDFAPYAYTILPVLEEYYAHIAEYLGKRLAGKPAKWAGPAPLGEPTYNDKRKFGLVFLQGVGSDVNPRIKPVVDQFKRKVKADFGVDVYTIGYQFDIAQNQQQSTNIIGQLLNAGVNNVIFVGDPLYPIFLTTEATNQRYYPEWFLTGTGLTDTTFFGRTYNQVQWDNAFGFSPLWVFGPSKETRSGARTMHHIDPDADPGAGADVIQSPIQLIFSGIHYAGPNLTPTTWSEGLFLAPAVGGRVNAPLVKFTKDSPGAIKDFVEVWWNTSGTGRDELDKDGVGILMKSSKGKRYQIGEWTTGDALVFGDDPSPIFVSSETETLPHDADGHTHDADPPCRSCS